MRLLTLSLLFLVTACGQGGAQDKKGGPPPAVPVSAIEVAPQAVPVSFEAVGRTEGSRDVQVRARVAGIIEQQLYSEGDAVKAGAPRARGAGDRAAQGSGRPPRHQPEGSRSGGLQRAAERRRGADRPGAAAPSRAQPVVHHGERAHRRHHRPRAAVGGHADILLVVSMVSPSKERDTLYLSNYSSLNIVDELKRLPGIADVTIFGARDYSMRVWLNPAPPGQNIVYTVTATGRLVEPEQFGEIIVRAAGAQARLPAGRGPCSRWCSPSASWWTTPSWCWRTSSA